MDHFKRNPLTFNDATVVSEIERFKKEVAQRHMYKDHFQIHKEEMERVRKNKAKLQRIIRKYKINTFKRREHKPGE